MNTKSTVSKVAFALMSIASGVGTAMALAPAKDWEKKIELDVECISSPKPTITVNDNKNKEPVIWPEEVESNWEIQQSEKTLSTVLAKWSQKAGWQLVWDAERDFPIESQITLKGSFVMAVQAVMDSLNETDYPLQASMNPSTRVMRITRHMETRRK